MTLPNQPTNIIYTGVPGTGKTYQLQQRQQQYQKILQPDSIDAQLEALLVSVSWRDVIAAVLWQDGQALSVPNLVNHRLIQAKAASSSTSNLNQSLWSTLQLNTTSDSTTVNLDPQRRSSFAYFDKTADSQWVLLESVKPQLAHVETLLTQIHKLSQADIAPITLSRSVLVSFHQSYGYDEFVEGIRPEVTDNGVLNYRIQDGVFLQLCEQARQQPEYRFAVLIDEINRANINQVFGELLSLIEPSKRAGQPEAMSVTLAYSQRPFSVPSNVDIYATMNTADRSLAPLDLAMRRRFRFVPILPDATLLSIVDEVDLAKLLTALNQRLASLYGDTHMLGHSFLMGVSDISGLHHRFVEQVLPQLQALCNYDWQGLQVVLNEGDGQKPTELCWITTNTATSHHQSVSQNHYGVTGQTMQGSTQAWHFNPQYFTVKNQTILPDLYQAIYAN